MKKREEKKYKLVATAPDKNTFVFRTGNDKEKLEDFAVKFSSTRPDWKFVVMLNSSVS
jgi:hypothetical protein